MIKLEDPLTDDELQVQDVSSAFYSLKESNDLFFAIQTMHNVMEKEYSRNAQEIFIIERDLVEPYILTDTSIDGSTQHLYRIPDPLPDAVPSEVKAAVAWLDDQLLLNRQRLEKDLELETAPLKENLHSLQNKVTLWFKTQQGAGWLPDVSITLSGCTLKYHNGAVEFEYHEFNYD